MKILSFLVISLSLSLTAQSQNWLLIGNGTTNPATNFIGTTDVNDLVFRTNSIERLRISQKGRLLTNGVNNNLFIGNATGNETLTGINNVSLGDFSNQTSTTGYDNVAVGTYSLQLNTSGRDNSAFGCKAMIGNSTGIRNVAVGSLALFPNSSGNDNTSIGTLACNANTTGSGNTVVGYFAMPTNITGSNNTIIGNAADVTVNNLTNATAIGYNAKVASSNAFIIGDATAAIRVGIGTNNPNSNAKLEVIGNIYCSSKIYVGTPDANTQSKIAVYALAVNGDAIANRVRVKLYTNWPDYVFDKNYQLLPIKKLEQFIRKEKHLPNVASVFNDDLSPIATYGSTGANVTVLANNYVSGNSGLRMNER